MGLGHSPSIVLDGLVFSVDAVNSRSYSGSGNTAYSLIGGYSGTLLNGVGYTTANSGSFVFDGTNDYMTFTNLDVIGSVYTQNIWFKFNVLQTALLFDQGWSGSVLFSNRIEWYYTSVSPNYFGANYNFTTNRWYMLSLVRGSTLKSIYIDGNLIGSLSSSDSYDSPYTNIYIGANGGSIQFLNGNIGSIAVYDRALSNSELRQNFNATKKRYGL